MKFKIAASALLIALALAIVLALAVLLQGTEFISKKDPVVVSTAGAPGRDASSILRAIRTRQVHPRASKTMPGRTSFNEALPGEIATAVSASSERDSPAAQLALAKAYEQCARNMHTDAEFEEDAAKLSLKLDAVQQKSGQQSGVGDVTAFAVAQVARAKKIRDSCMSIPVDQIAQWHAMLQKLAMAGDQEATEPFVAAFWRDHLHPTEADKDDADYLRDLELTRGFLWNRISEGECDDITLNALSRLKLGPVTNYIGWNILGQRGLTALDKHGWSPTQIDTERTALQAEFDRLRSSVPTDQLDEANQTVAYLQQFNCGD